MRTLKRNLIKEYFTFTARERRAVVVLVLAAIMFSMLPHFFPHWIKSEVEPYSAAVSLPPVPATEQRTTDWQDRNNDAALMAPSYKRHQPFWEQGERFYFDPNTATAADWKRMGIRDKTIRSILNYRSKGGVFRKPEDLSRIYTLHPNMYEALRPFIRISTTTATSTAVPASATFLSDNRTEPPVRIRTIDINSADATEWMQLRGIGAGYAKRILNFREKLGGFLTVDQVGETFGLPDTTFQKIKPYLVADTQALRRININEASAQELMAHPYIDGRTAKNIIAFREQHGNFSAVEQLLKIGSIDEALFLRIAPYLTVGGK